MTLFWTCLEILFFTNLKKVPQSLHHYLEDRFQILAQLTKKDVIPKEYIMLVGDSYAQGLGDWVENQDKDGSYYSGHIISKSLKKELITTGRGGADNTFGVLFNPIQYLSEINTIPFINIDSPKEILVYFYEGNDISDNILSMNLLNKDSNEKQIKEDVASSFEEHKSYFQNINSFYKKLPLLSFLTNIVKKEVINSLIGEAHANKGVVKISYNYNRAFLNNEKVKIPDLLQGPSTELNKREIDQGFWVLKSSLKLLKRNFKKSKIYFIYIPSPLSLYNLSNNEVSIETFTKERYPFTSPEKIKENHLLFLSKAKKVCNELNLSFIDTSEKLRERAKDTLIHGPKDWFHLNKVGQTILAHEIINSSLMR